MMPSSLTKQNGSTAMSSEDNSALLPKLFPDKMQEWQDTLHEGLDTLVVALDIAGVFRSSVARRLHG
ncbi:hypothetical protein E2C01_045240 [Portunus trituberculatus]|uniref:Uncharacterized protein n=1 Tax=Portunus trituberculatus TaxID=210409 RepID=A0A5B7G0Q7_PORTR|nr:hypothetical protein [Portunus trituberculatus]